LSPGERLPEGIEPIDGQPVHDQRRE
jgi:hypothetical protein